MLGNRLRGVLFGITSATLSITSALGQEQQLPTHPAESASATTQPAIDAMKLAVPLLDRAAAHPSYGPTPPGEAPDAVAEMQDMMEMDHSAHQMPGTDMPEMDHGAMPEGAQ